MPMNRSSSIIVENDLGNGIVYRKDDQVEAEESGKTQ